MPKSSDCGIISGMTFTLLAVLTTLAAVPAPGDEPLPVVRTTAELNDCTLRANCCTSKFNICGTIQRVNVSRNRQLVIEDEAGRSIVAFPPTLRPKAGDRVRLTGRAGIAPNHEPWSWVKEIDVLGSGSVSPPKDVRLAELDERIHHLCEIRTEGVVVEMFDDEIDPDTHFLLVKDGARILPIAITGGPRLSSAACLDARIAFGGLFVGPSGGWRKYAGPYVLVTDSSAIRVIEPPPADPFGSPPLESRLYLSPEAISQLGKRTVAGIALATWDGDMVMIRDGEGRIVHAQLQKGVSLPTCGASITAAGYPETDMFRVNLGRARFRIDGAGDDDDCAEDLEASGLFEDASGRARINCPCHGKLLRARGIVRTLPAPGGDGRRLLVDCGKFTVPVDCGTCPEATDGLPIGSEIEVTGRCLLETGTWRPSEIFPRIQGFRLLLRTADDVRILALPSWWTPARLLVVIAALLLALVAVYIWNRALNRLALRRGRELFREQVAKIKADFRVGERTRLAVELHDSLSQNLTGVALEVSAASRDTDPSSVRAHRHLALAEKTLKSCRDELRNCLWDLRNDTLSEPDLNEAIRHTIASKLGDVRLDIRFRVPRTRLTDNTTHVILRILRELAVNAVRHGQATEIRIVGSIEGDTLVFSVADNGCGFDVDHRPGIAEGHFGLQGIQERVESLEGELSIVSQIGKGTEATVALRLPGGNSKEESR